MNVFLRQGAAIALLLLPNAAFADTSPAAAEALFNEARTLLSSGRTAEACNRFERSQELDPAVGTLLNLGDCYERLGKTASAWIAYRKGITLANARQDERRSAVAAGEAQRLEPVLAKLRIEVETPAPGIVVVFRGTPIDRASFGTPFPVDPGTETLTASAPGRKPWSTTLAIAPGTTKTISVPPLEADTPHAPPPARRTTGMSLATGLEIGGGIALGASLAFGTVALVQWSAVTDACPDRRCPNEATLRRQDSEKEDARTFAHVSTALGIAGAIALAAGLFLDLTSPPRVAVGFDGTNVALRLRTP